MRATTRIGRVEWKKKENYFSCEKLAQGKRTGTFGTGQTRDSAFKSLEEILADMETTRKQRK